MPRTKVVFYRESDGIAPVLEWFEALPANAQDKCRVRIQRLAEMGHELHRPEADLLREGIYELRIGLQHINYRILYFFQGRVAAVLAHGLTKKDRVPNTRSRRHWLAKAEIRTEPNAPHLRGVVNCFNLSGKVMAQMKRTSERKPTSDAIEIIHRRYYQGRPQRMAELAEAEANDTVARKIYELRKRAGLTQEQLAKLVGTSTSVICRLEDADYQGHSLAMLKRIAGALNKRVELRFVSAARKSKVA